MIITKMVWTKENVREFVTYYTLYKSKTQRILLISYLICAAFICIFGLTVFFILKETIILFVSLGAFVIMAGYIIFFYMMMRSMAKKLITANAENNDLEVCFNEDVIFIRKDNEPFGAIYWDNINEIYTAKNTAYLMSKENALILVEYNRIIAGSKEEFIKLLESKNEQLTKDKPKK